MYIKQSKRITSGIYDMTKIKVLRYGALAGTISSLQGLVYDLASFSAADLHFHTGTLVHLYVRLLWLLQGPHLRLYRLHEISKLIRHTSTCANSASASLQRERLFFEFLKIKTTQASTA